MSEFVVKWKHWRYYLTLDQWFNLWKSCVNCRSKQRKIAHNIRHSFVLEPERSIKYRAIHGGATQCNIWSAADYNTIDRDAHVTVIGITICSPFDQFDRRVGRLYSLALALCEFDGVVTESPDLCDQLNSCVRGAYSNNPLGDELWEGLLGYIMLKNKPTVKHICSEIVASWKPPRNTMKREDANAGYRPFHPSLQAGDGDTMPCGHPASAMVRGEYWGKDAEGRENYTWYCGKCSDDGSRHV